MRQLETLFVRQFGIALIVIENRKAIKQKQLRVWRL